MRSNVRCLVIASVISFIKAKVYHYFIHTKVVKIFIKQLYMCWYYFYSPNMKYLTYIGIHITELTLGKIMTSSLHDASRVAFFCFVYSWNRSVA